MKTMESQHIVNLLEKFHGRRREVARAMGVSERTLYRKMRQYHLR